MFFKHPITNIWITQIDREQFQQLGYSLRIKVGSWNVWCELRYVNRESYGRNQNCQNRLHFLLPYLGYQTDLDYCNWPILKIWRQKSNQGVEFVPLCLRYLIHSDSYIEARDGLVCGVISRVHCVRRDLLRVSIIIVILFSCGYGLQNQEENSTKT